MKGRKTGGRQKGSLNKATLEKDQAREVARQLITQHLQPLIEAQVVNALGLKYLVTRDKKTGKFIRVTEAMARHKQDNAPHEETIEVWEKDPNVQAFTDLMNRAIDKPKEQAFDVAVTGLDDLLAKLDAGRAANARAQRSKS